MMHACWRGGGGASQKRPLQVLCNHCSKGNTDTNWLLLEVKETTAKYGGLCTGKCNILAQQKIQRCAVFSIQLCLICVVVVSLSWLYTVVSILLAVFAVVRGCETSNCVILLCGYSMWFCLCLLQLQYATPEGIFLTSTNKLPFLLHHMSQLRMLRLEMSLNCFSASSKPHWFVMSKDPHGTLCLAWIIHVHKRATNLVVPSSVVWICLNATCPCRDREASFLRSRRATKRFMSGLQKNNCFQPTAAEREKNLPIFFSV